MKIVTAALFSLFVTAAATAQVIGFESTTLTDARRPWRSESAADRVEPRSIPLSIWYPAASAPQGATPRTIRDWMNATAEEQHLGTRVVTAKRGDAWLDETLAGENIDRAKFDAIANRTTRAIPGAARSRAKHPAVLLMHMRMWDRVALAEELASRGIVVAAIPSFGRFERDFEATAAGVEAISGDAALALEALRARADVDPARIHVVGYSFGSLPVVTLLARDPRLAGGISIDGAIGGKFGADNQSKLVDAPAGRVRAPFVHIYATGGIGGETALLDRFSATTRTLIALPKSVTHDEAAGALLAEAAKEPTSTARMQRVHEIVVAAIESQVNGVATKQLPQIDGIAVTASVVEPIGVPILQDEAKVVIRQGRVAELLATPKRLTSMPASELKQLCNWLTRSRSDALGPVAALYRDAYPASAEARYYLAVVAMRAERNADALAEVVAALARVDGDPEMDPSSKGRFRSLLEGMQKRLSPQ